MNLSKRASYRSKFIQILPRSIKRGIRRLLFGRERLFVLGGHGGTLFDDNSRALAEYISQQDGYLAAFVFSRRHGDLSIKIRQSGVIPLKMGRLTTRIAISTADSLFFSHSLKDLSKDMEDFGRESPIVYLGHGVWAMKRIERRGLGTANSNFTHTIAASDEEAAVKRSVLKLPPDKVLMTGLPKHDKLIQLKSSLTASRKEWHVLYAPTWRDWLSGANVSGDELREYLAGIESILSEAPSHRNDSREIQLSLLLHKNAESLRPELERLCCRHNVKLCMPDSEITKLLAASDALISDYSSIIWDFVAMGKPIARFLFDEDRYEQRTGSYKSLAISEYLPSLNEAKDVWREILGGNSLAYIMELRNDRLTYSDGNSCLAILQELGFK